MLYQLAALTAEGAIPVIHSSDLSLLKELGNRFLSDLTLHRAGKQLTDARTIRFLTHLVSNVEAPGCQFLSKSTY